MAGNNIQQLFNLHPYFVDSSKTPGFNWEKFQDKIDALPDSLYDILVDEKTSDFIKLLTQKYIQLSVQGPDLARLIRDVVIGDIFFGDIPSEISKKLGIDSGIAREIANLIVSQLFAPVLDDIKKVQATKFPGRVSQPQPPTPQQNIPRPVPGADLPETGGNIIDLRNQK